MIQKSKMIFRFLNKDDVEIYRELKRFSLIESPLAFSDSYEDELTKTDTDYLRELEIVGSPAETFVIGVFTDTKKLVGFVKFKRDKRTKARHKASLHSLYIKPEYRNKGIGKRLINHLFETISVLNGLEQVHLWVLISDTSVVEFYEKNGFCKQGTIVKNDLKIADKYVDAFYMVKQLK